MNRDEPAFAGPVQHVDGIECADPGLTKREYAVVHSDHHEVNDVMVYAGWNNTTDVMEYARNIARAKIILADALFDELGKEQP